MICINILIFCRILECLFRGDFYGKVSCMKKVLVKKNLGKKVKKIKKYILTLKVWKWPGDGAWHFVTLPKNLYTEIRGIHGKGMVPIRTTVYKTTWDNSLFPHTQSQSYILAIRKSVRNAEGIFEGDEIPVSFVLR